MSSVLPCQSAGKTARLTIPRRQRRPGERHDRAVGGASGGAFARSGPPGALVFKPPAFQIHAWQPQQGFVSHTVYIDAWTGPFPFLTDADYPGRGL
jgi:hypothetical protein